MKAFYIIATSVFPTAIWLYGWQNWEIASLVTAVTYLTWVLTGIPGRRTTDPATLLGANVCPECEAKATTFKMTQRAEGGSAGFATQCANCGTSYVIAQEAGGPLHVERIDL